MAGHHLFLFRCRVHRRGQTTQWTCRWFRCTSRLLFQSSDRGACDVIRWWSRFFVVSLIDELSFIICSSIIRKSMFQQSTLLGNDLECTTHTRPLMPFSVIFHVTYFSDQFATCSISFASILFLLFLRGNSISCRSIFQGEFTENFTERGHLRLLDDTARITEPEKKLLKSIHHTTID